MAPVTRRHFIARGGAGSLAAALLTAPSAALVATASQARLPAEDLLSLRAVAGMPAWPLPSYASLVLEGQVDLRRGTGLLAQRVFAGPPVAISEVALPGFTRLIRVTKSRRAGVAVLLEGVVEDRAQLQPGEDPRVSLRVDTARGLATIRFMGDDRTLQLER
jgi:hypothetical protein